MYCKQMVAECQENLQHLVSAVGSKTEDITRLEKLLLELAQICSDNPQFQIRGKAIWLARENKFIDANFCYRVYLQDYKFSDLKGIDIYLKCALLANNINNIHYGHEIIFKSVTELVEKYFIDDSEFQPILNSGFTYKDFDFFNLSHKMGYGDYSGFSIKEILDRNPEYLLWCIIHVDNFALDNRIMIDKKLLRSNLYAKAVAINLAKNAVIAIWDDELEDEVNDELENHRSYSWEKETFDATTDGQLGDWEDFEGDIDDARTSMGLD